MGKAKQEMLNDYALWTEDMPDITGQALADAEREFLAEWIQLELDLWEGRHGINEQTYWDMAGRGSRG